MRSSVLALAAVAAVAAPVFATPQYRNATDMWFDPAESGWGLNLIHQGDTLFGTLFVYASDGQPKWFVASNLRGGGGGPGTPGVYSGTLSECAGPWFGGPFDASSVACRDVGPMRFELGDATAALDYTVDGVRVTKTVRRFTFRRTTLEGRYEGYMVQPGVIGTPPNKTDLTFNVSDNGLSVTMYTSSDSQTECDWSATPTQDGQLEAVSGQFTCGPPRNPLRSGPWSMKVDPTTEGFSGTFTGDGISSGRIAAARAEGSVRMQGLGWRNDMWFLPAESGWGFNVIEQGDTLFGTLFVYDPQRRPRWYVASGLTQQGDAADGSVTYSGPLYENTGTYYGAAFNPNAVNPRVVGQMSFRANPDGSGNLAYSVDGVQVAKTVQRFAFRKQDFSGSYYGSYAHDRQANITIDDGAEFRMQLVDLYGGSGTCNFVAPFSQVGSLRTMSGTFTCGTSTTGTFVLRHATVSAHGFASRFDSPLFNFWPKVDAHVGGVRR